MDDEYVPSSKSYSDRGDDDFSYENLITKPVSLFDHLEWQLQLNLNEEDTTGTLQEPASLPG